MVRVTKSTLATGQISEHAPHKYVSEASDLGFAPGNWPRSIDTDLGNGLAFWLEYSHVEDGDLQWRLYRQVGGCIELKVFND